MQQRLMLLEGTIGRVPVIAAAARWRHSSGNWIRRSPLLHSPARRVLRAYRSIKHGLLYESFNF